MDFLFFMSVAMIAVGTYNIGRQRERARVRRLLRGAAIPLVPGYPEDQEELLHAAAVRVDHAGAYRIAWTGDRGLVAQALRAAAEDVSPFTF